MTYIVQRFASLATMLYLLSLVLFLEWRLTRELASAGPLENRNPLVSLAAKVSVRSHFV